MADSTKLTDRIGQFLKDTVTLDVITLTGTIELDASVTDKPKAADGDKGAATADAKEESLNWDKLFAKVTEQMKPAAKNQLEVLAYTHAEWDCDSVNFVAKEADSKLIESHHKAVESAHKSRYAALEFIGKALSNI